MGSPLLTATDRLAASVTVRDFGTRRYVPRTVVTLTWGELRAEVTLNADEEVDTIEVDRAGCLISSSAEDDRMIGKLATEAASLAHHCGECDTVWAWRGEPVQVEDAAEAA